MKEIKLEDILKKTSELPEEIKAILFGEEISETIQEIGNKHKLMIDQLGDLADEINLVVLGFTAATEFKNSLQERLGVDAATSSGLADEINKMIFQKIRAKLMEIKNGKDSTTPSIPQDQDDIKSSIPTMVEGEPTSAATPMPGAPSVKPEISTSSVEPVQKSTPPLIVPPLNTPAQNITKKTEIGSVENTIKTLEPRVSPFKQKLEEDVVFRTPAQTSKHEAPPAVPETDPRDTPATEDKVGLPPLPTKEDIKYGGKDPYREPLE